MDRLQDRLKLIIQAETDPSDQLEDLGLKTGLSVDRWRTFWRGTTFATCELIEAAAITWPQYAFWLSTGLTDPERGHVAPKTYVEAFPVRRGVAMLGATEEWRYLLELRRRGIAGYARPSNGRRKVRDPAEAASELEAAWLAFVRGTMELDEDSAPEIFIAEIDGTFAALHAQRVREERERLAGWAHLRADLQAAFRRKPAPECAAGAECPAEGASDQAEDGPEYWGS